MAWLSRRLAAFGHAFHGLATLLKETPHAQFHLLATAGVVALGAYLDVSRTDWQALVLAIALVWVAEGMNTALEYLADAAVPEQHPLVGKAKDVAAGAVLLSAGFSIVIALLVFGPYVAG